MSYRYKLEDLLALLYPSAPALVDAVSVNRRKVEHGLLSVGLKIHCLGDGTPFNKLIKGLGGVAEILEVNAYRRTGASLCWVLPPIGNARAAIHLLEAIELATKARLFNNKDIQIQVCSPGRLSREHAAFLAIGFYLGSDVLRRYTLGDFATTFSTFKEPHPVERGKRVVLYDANGDFDHEFEWWKKTHGNLAIAERLPFDNGRTDVLTAQSKVDIENINLLATLLAHVRWGGYWHKLGYKFERKMRALLERHLLGGLLLAPWIRTDESVGEGDARFIDALRELSAYAFDDTWRSHQPKRSVAHTQGYHGILREIKTLLQDHRAELINESQRQRGVSRA